MTAEGIYRLLLRAYPPDFRAEYGREMVLLFRDQCRESDVRTVGFWARVLYDVARSAPALRAAAWRARETENTRTVEVIMKLAAMLTVLLGGVFGILSAVVEWVAAAKQTISGTHELSMVLGVLASALLLAAGAAILSRTPRGREAARLALLASFALIVAARVLHPWMSIFFQLVGIGLPVAFLIALYWPRKSSTLGAASIVVVGFAVPQLCRAQALPLGRWTGSAGSMDQPAFYPLTFDVTAVGDSLRIMLHSTTGDDYRLDTIRLSGDTLRFTLQLARALPPGDAPGGAHGARCMLLRQRDGSHTGTCTGSNGMPSSMRMVPPGSTQAADTVRDLPLTAAQRQSFVGTYSVTLPMGGRDVLRVFEENGLLKAHSSHENRTGRLLYQGDGAFRPEGSNFVITFVFDSGRATRFTGHREDGVMKGTRTQ
jgi:hypothetical protein